MQGKAEDAGGLTPVKDDNAAMRTLYLRTFARNSDDCYKICSRRQAAIQRGKGRTDKKEPLSKTAAQAGGILESFHKV